MTMLTMWYWFPWASLCRENTVCQSLVINLEYIVGTCSCRIYHFFAIPKKKAPDKFIHTGVEHVSADSFSGTYTIALIIYIHRGRELVSLPMDLQPIAFAH